MSNIKLYKTFEDKVGVIAPIYKVVDAIKTGHWEEKVSLYRETKDHALKEALPCFTVGGVFGKSKHIENLVSKSGYCELDIDAIEVPISDIIDILQDAIGTPVYAVFKSCGGGGICVLVKIKDYEDYDQYKAIYNSIYQKLHRHLSKISKFDWLPNLNRLRFVSYDPYIYINDEVEDYTDELPIKEVEVGEGGTGKSNKILISGKLNDAELLGVVLEKFIEFNGEFGSGQITRHDWVLGLARWGCRADISEGFLEDYVLSNFVNSDRGDVWGKEVKRCVRDSYKSYQSERGSYEVPKKFEYDDILGCTNKESVRQQVYFLIADKINYKKYLEENNKKTLFVEKEIKWLKKIVDFI